VKKDDKIVRTIEVVEFLSDALRLNHTESIEEIFHLEHPRYKALLKMQHDVLDVGAGDGGMGQLLSWPVELDQVQLVGCDLHQPSPLPIGYSDWVTGGWRSIGRNKKFGGILAIHVVEHVNSWREMLDSIIGLMEDNAYIYIEWPVLECTEWPKASDVWKEFQKQHYEYSVQLLSTFNFYDDDSHLNLPPKMEEVLQTLTQLEVMEEGKVYLRSSAQKLVSQGLRDQSIPNVTIGIWAEFGFAQYILAKKL
jgi:hypothetical protein